MQTKTAQLLVWPCCCWPKKPLTVAPFPPFAEAERVIIEIDNRARRHRGSNMIPKNQKEVSCENKGRCLLPHSSFENMRTSSDTSGLQRRILIYVKRAALVRYSNDEDPASDASDSTPRNVSSSSKLPSNPHPCAPVFHLCGFVRVSGVSVFHDREIRVHKILKCHNVQMVSSSPNVDTLWSLSCPGLCIENLSMRSSKPKSAILAQISSGLRRPMPPPSVLTPQKTDLTSATESMNLDSSLDSQSNTPARLAPTQTEGPTSLVRADMEDPTSQGEENDDEQLRRLREILMPPPIEGQADWGIPPATTEPCDSALEVCLH